MRRETPAIVVVGFAILFLLLLVLQVRVLPDTVNATAATFPEVAPLVPVAIAWGAAAIACLQLALIIAICHAVGTRLQPSGRPPRGWLLTIVACLIGFLALVVAAVITLIALSYTSPGVLYGLIVAALLAVVVIMAVARRVRVATAVGHN